ncbi:hypothetical protein B0H16DRAFT_321957 [Mycena metata]|uniref:Uncharacterized protein n=1 Tax=Mycena metata TaxID=1033252 RepID=A0AAD7HNM7_9AGAR|nr:hypothetical protein B0H16DRAFT_321957 [Mycena metata]
MARAAYPAVSIECALQWSFIVVYARAGESHRHLSFTAAACAAESHRPPFFCASAVGSPCQLSSTRLRGNPTAISRLRLRSWIPLPALICGSAVVSRRCPLVYVLTAGSHCWLSCVCPRWDLTAMSRLRVHGWIPPPSLVTPAQQDPAADSPLRPQQYLAAVPSFPRRQLDPAAISSFAPAR